jgi:hypothetical protein
MLYHRPPPSRGPLQQHTAVRRHLTATALFVLLALVIVAPVLPDPARLALGHPANDVWNHVWGYWWFTQSILSGELPLHTDLLGWPEGGPLWFIDGFGALLTLPVFVLWGPVAAYNADICLQLVICGVGAYALALRATRSWHGAVAAGLVFLSSPHLLGQIYNGISETMAAGWMALALTVILWAIDKPSPRRGVAAGVALGIAALANWYYGLFAGLIMGLLLARDVWRRVREPGPAGDHRRAAASLVVAGIATIVVVAGPFLLFRQSMLGGDALVTRKAQFVWMTLILHNMTDLVSLFRPGKFYSPDLKAVFDEDLIVVVYLGHALLWPALAAPVLVTRRQRRHVWVWLVAFLGFTALTLGPFLYVAGQYVTAGDYWFGLPFLALFKYVPMFTSVSHAYRFVVGAYLGLAVLLAWAVRGMGQRGLPLGATVAVLVALRVGESLFGSPAVFPLPTTRVALHAVYGELGEGAVWDLPVGIPVLARSRYAAAQMIHGQPIPYALNDPTPAFLFHNRLGQYIMELERSRVALAPMEPPSKDLLLGREQLIAEGLRWIVLHKEPLPAAQYAKIAAFLDLVATPVFADEELRVYRLDP